MMIRVKLDDVRKKICISCVWHIDCYVCELTETLKKEKRFCVKTHDFYNDTLNILFVCRDLIG